MKNDELIELLENILRANYIPVHRIQLPCENPEFLDLGLRRHILGIQDTSSFFNNLLESLKPCKIYLVTDLYHCTYALMHLKDENAILHCGPVVFEKIQEDRFEEIFASLSLPSSYHDAMEAYYQQLCYQSSYPMFESIFLEFGKTFYDGKCELIYSNADFFDHWNQTYENCLRDTEHPFSNIDVIEKRYESENTLINAVASGNESRAMEMAAKFGTYFLPKRTTNNLRDVKDYTITLNTLLRKAAEKAGVHPIHIDSYSNCNIAMLEKLTSVEQCMSAQRKIVLGYCQIVREHQQKSHSPLIRRILAYAETDLSADLTLKSLSAHLGVNASYLSTLFSKEMGMSLTEYVNTLRISHAKILLENSNIPIKSIASRCGIEDIHYFTRVFKKNCGVTPKGYRESTLKLRQENIEPK